jgi:hypothetical protein
MELIVTYFSSTVVKLNYPEKIRKIATSQVSKLTSDITFGHQTINYIVPLDQGQY